jgi:hypothetical protein
MLVFQKVIDRRQSFRTTHEYPYGWIEETLECGHVRIEPIQHGDIHFQKDTYERQARDPKSRHYSQTTKRACEDCTVEASRKAKKRKREGCAS